MLIWPISIPVLLALLTLNGCMWRGDEALLVLQDLGAGSAPSNLKRLTPEPTRLRIDYQLSGRAYQADLYLPGEPPRASILLVPGVAQQGRDDPRLVAFAATLARARFLVLVPDLPGLRSLRVSGTDVQAVVDAFSYLQTRAERPAQGGRGIAAFSYAVGPAVLAALDPAIKQQVDFVLGVGGYYDLRQVLVYFTTGYFRAEGEWAYLAPNPYGKWVFLRGNVDRLKGSKDRRVLAQIAGEKLTDPSAPVPDLAGRLGPEGKSVYRFVSNNDRAAAPALAAGLPAAIQDELEALTLSNKDLSGLAARLILVHGLDDSIIPYSQSVALAAAAGGRSELFLIDGLAHVDLQPGRLDRWAAWQAVRALLVLRERRSQAP